MVEVNKSPKRLSFLIAIISYILAIPVMGIFSIISSDMAMRVYGLSDDARGWGGAIVNIIIILPITMMLYFVLSIYIISIKGVYKGIFWSFICTIIANFIGTCICLFYE